MFDSTDLAAIIPHSIALLFLTIASYTDLKTREVPDWVNFSLVAIGLGLNAIFSIVFLNYHFALASIIGFGIVFLLGWIIFYSGQWGGGDSKMLMGLGALIGIDIFKKEIPFLGYFLLNLVVVGALYGLLWTIILMVKHRQKFWKEFKGQMQLPLMKRLRLVGLVLFLALLVAAIFSTDQFLRIMFLYAALLSGLMIYVWMAVKSVERSCMLKLVEPKKVTEGDWIAKDIIVAKKYIAGPKDLGISKEQIRTLLKLEKQKKISKVLIKEGIPFIPSFLLAYIATLVFGNALFGVFWWIL